MPDLQVDGAHSASLLGAGASSEVGDLLRRLL
jgi:hypothetical protein